jgi:hypothetical protein
MKIRVKVGTMPAEYARFLWLKKPPKVGDCPVLKREGRDVYSSQMRVTVQEIRNVDGEPLYFVS